MGGGLSLNDDKRLWALFAAEVIYILWFYLETATRAHTNRL